MKAGWYKLAGGKNERKEDEIIDNLLKGYKEPDDRREWALKELMKRQLEQAMPAEISQHAGYEKYEASGLTDQIGSVIQK